MKKKKEEKKTSAETFFSPSVEIIPRRFLRTSQGLWVMGNGNNVIYFRRTEAHKSKNEGNRGTNVIFGSIEQGKMLKYFRGTREQVPLAPLGGPHFSIIHCTYLCSFREWERCDEHTPVIS